MGGCQFDSGWNYYPQNWSQSGIYKKKKYLNSSLGPFLICFPAFAKYMHIFCLIVIPIIMYIVYIYGVLSNFSLLRLNSTFIREIDLDSFVLI